MGQQLPPKLLAVISRTEDGYCAHYPDMPGHVCPGSSLSAVIETAPSALREHLASRDEIDELLLQQMTVPTGRPVGRILVSTGLPT